MNESHTALIVEDDAATAEDLHEILRSIDCTSVLVDNSEDALRQAQSRSFCFVLLDLQIKGAADAIKGHIEHGKALLRKLRQMHGEHNGLPFWLPILVLSGYAREADAAVEVMKDGASDVIQKPVDSQLVSDRIRRALDLSGRASHALCHQEPASGKRAKAEDDVVIAIPGDRIRRRTRVLVGAAEVEVTDNALKVLLHLMVARLNRTVVNKVTLGAAPDEGFKGISRLREQLRPALAGRDIIKNEYHGDYRLTDDVTIGECAVDKLLEIDDATISELAKQLQAPRGPH
jgi:FixJ family two-component response regulator